MVDRRKQDDTARRDSRFQPARHLVVNRTLDPRGFRIIGSIDSSNAGAFADWLRDIVHDRRDGKGSNDTHIYVRMVEFCDTTGIRKLVDTARELDGDGRLIVHELPHKLGATIRAVGWSLMPSLVVADRRSAD